MKKSPANRGFLDDEKRNEDQFSGSMTRKLGIEFGSLDFFLVKDFTVFDAFIFR